MKTNRFGLFFILTGIFLPFALRAENIDAPSKISEVTVFPDRALVTREAQLNLAPGVHSVKLSPMPGTIEEDSISVRGKGQAKVKLFGARLETTQLVGPQPEKVKELTDQLKKLNDRRRELDDVKAVLQKKREFVESIKAASLDQIGKDIVTKQPSVTDITQIAVFIEQQLQDIYNKSRAADFETLKIDEERDRIERELHRLEGEFQKQQAAIVVDVEAENAGAFTLEVTYRLPDATWEPVYEARAKSGAGTAEVQLASYGLVRQRTGENWQDVTVRLSTAKPAIGGRMPEVQPWYIRKFEPPPVIVEKKMRLAARAEAPMRAAEEAFLMESAPPPLLPPVPAAVAVAAVESRGAAVLFTLPKKETIASDWQPRKVSIASSSLPAALAYETNPRYSPYAYLRAKVKNNSEGLLLAGPVQIFLDDAFTGSSSIDVTGPNEEFDLFLGIDERIKVERRQLQAKSDVSVLPGVHGRVKTIDYEYLTTVENTGRAPVEITVTDQLPVSQHDEIKVKLGGQEPKPTDLDSEKPGVQRWKLTLPAGSKKEIKTSYRVSHPADFIVEGL